VVASPLHLPGLVRKQDRHQAPGVIGQWRKTALEQLADLFMDGRKSKRADSEVEKDALYEEIGRLKVELDWLKKKVGLLD